MQWCSLLLLVLTVALASSTETEDSSPTPSNTTEATPSPTPAEEGAAEGAGDTSWWVSGCRYYCIWKERPYCCDDGSQPLPPDHDLHGGMYCPPMVDHICKKDGIYLATHAIQTARYSGSLPLVKGSPKEQRMCASDGYCDEEEKCCPSPCAGRHICLPALQPADDDDSEEEGDVLGEEEEEEGDLALEEREEGDLALEEEEEEGDLALEEEEDGDLALEEEEEGDLALEEEEEE